MGQKPDNNENRRKFTSLLVEVIALAILVGAVPDLLISALRDLWGPCGFSDQVCAQVVRQGLVEGVAGLCCGTAAVMLVFFISQEYNDRN